MSQSAEILKDQFFKSLGLPWQEILPASRLNQILEEEGIKYRNRVYTPVATLWVMIYQVLSADRHWCSLIFSLKVRLIDS